MMNFKGIFLFLILSGPLLKIIHAQEGPPDYFTRDGLLFLDISSPAFLEHFNDPPENLPLYKLETETPKDKEELQKIIPIRCSHCGDKSPFYYVSSVQKNVSEFLDAFREAEEGIRQEKILQLACGHSFCPACTSFADHGEEITHCPINGCSNPHSKVKRGIGEKIYVGLNLSEEHYPGLNVKGWDLRGVSISRKNLEDMVLEKTTVDLDIYRDYLVSILVGEENPKIFFKKLEEVDYRMSHPDSNKLKAKLLLDSWPKLCENPEKNFHEFLMKAVSYFDFKSSLEELQRFYSLIEDQKLTPDLWGKIQASLLQTRSQVKERAELLSSFNKILISSGWKREEISNYFGHFSQAQDLYSLLKTYLNHIHTEEDLLHIGQIFLSKLSKNLKGSPKDIGKLNEVFRRKGRVLISPGERGPFLEQFDNKKVHHHHQILSVGYAHNCIISEEDKVKCWGANGAGQSTPPHDLGKVKSIALGFDQSCAVNDEDEIKCWGGASRDNRHMYPHNLGKVKSIALGYGHSCAITDEDKVTCWGDNSDNQSSPPDDLGKFKTMALGGLHGCAITEEDEVRCWGRNNDNQSTPPRDLGKVKSIALGAYHSCAVNEEDEVRCWGKNEINRSTPPDDLGEVKAIALGGYHSCAITIDEQVKCWGDNSNGQSTPPHDLGRVQSIALGWVHSCAITLDDRVRCWGANGSGQSRPPHDLGNVKRIYNE